MKILFIHPNASAKTRGNRSKSPFFVKILSKITEFAPQIVFPVLASVTPEKHSITVINERFHDINFNDKYDIVGITSRTFEAKRAYEIADEFRKRGIIVILGGWHPSALPEEAKRHADAVVLGEAEELWPQILNDVENGKLKPFYYQEKPVDFEKTLHPKRNILTGIFLAAGVQATKSCPYGCEYCALAYSRHGRIYRQRPIEEVVDEIRKIPQKIITFYDASLTIDVKYTKSLFRELKNLNKKLICNGNIDVLSRDDELLKYAKEAGCIQWNIGFESISEESLREVKKRTNKVEYYQEAVKKIHEHGMSVTGLFMFGFDGDHVDVFKNTLDFIQKSGIDAADFSILTPLPMTPLRDRLLKENRVLTNDWSRYNFSKNVVFKPKNLTEEELCVGVQNLYKNFYSASGIMIRSLKSIKRGGYQFFMVVIQNAFPRLVFKKIF